jgi:hypothetical protein
MKEVLINQKAHISYSENGAKETEPGRTHLGPWDILGEIL